MTVPLVTRIAPDPQPATRHVGPRLHAWRDETSRSYGPPQQTEPSPALRAAGFRERTREDMSMWWRGR